MSESRNRYAIRVSCISDRPDKLEENNNYMHEHNCYRYWIHDGVLYIKKTEPNKGFFMVNFPLSNIRWWTVKGLVKGL